MADEIEISLFGNLDEVGEIIGADEEVKDEELVLKLHKIETKLESFLENFYLQFFNNAFKLDIDGMNEETFSGVERHFSEHKDDSPRNTIGTFKDLIEVLKDIEKAVYSDPPDEDDIKNAYLVALPKLFDSFKKDEDVLKGRIANYGAIKVRMEGILVRIGKINEQKNLS
jgi:hypothetical protein